jgi:uncharacterized protein YuzB (UPF0349 family)
MRAAISCCINNLVLHQYGDKLQELAAEGMDIRLERCLSQCAGCRRQPAFAVKGRWIGVEPGQGLKKTVYANVE